MERASKSVAGFVVLLSRGSGEVTEDAPWGHLLPRSVPQRKEPSAPGSVPRGMSPVVGEQRGPRSLVGLRDGGGSHPELALPSF